MFSFTYADEELKSKLTKTSYWDELLKDELLPALKELAERGESSLSPDYGCNAYGDALRLRGRTFEIIYSVRAKAKLIKFYECKFIASSQSLNWKKLLLQESFDTSLEEEIALPQVGIKRIFSALKLIYEGKNKAYDLGLAAGSKAKTYKHVARYGQYNAEFLKQAGLISVYREGNKAMQYYCSNLIQQGFEQGDFDHVLRFVAESLLGFPVIRESILATTTGKEELSLDLIQNIWQNIDPVRYSPKTAKRRAQTIRGLINWLAREAGIPIRYEGSQHVQLYLNLDIYERES